MPRPRQTSTHSGPRRFGRSRVPYGSLALLERGTPPALWLPDQVGRQTVQRASKRAILEAKLNRSTHGIYLK
jgi:hypothetical protein